jgi:hypothetical protein
MRAFAGAHTVEVVSRTLAIALMLGLLVVLGAAGCGGDTRRGESETTEAATAPAVPNAMAEGQAGAGGPVVATRVTDPARRAYVARVDSVCSRFDPERSRAQERVAGMSRPGEAAKTYDETVGLGRMELRQIEAIPMPPGEGELLQANVFSVIGRELAIRREIGRALAATDISQLRRLRSELDGLSRSLGGFARGYGFRVCGED